MLVQSRLVLELLLARTATKQNIGHEGRYEVKAILEVTGEAGIGGESNTAGTADKRASGV